MAQIKWKTGTGGLWSTGANWSGGAAPGPADFAVIAAAPAQNGRGYTVTLNVSSAGTATQIAGLTINQTRAVLDVAAGTLAVSSAISLTAGTLTLTDATLFGGDAASSTGSATVTAASGFTVALSTTYEAPGHGTLSNLAWHGTLDLVGAAPIFRGGSATLVNTSFAGLDGSGAGTLVANDVAVFLETTGTINDTLSNVNVFLQNGAALVAEPYGTLTLAAGTAVSAGNNTSIQAHSVANAGYISVSGTASSLTIAADQFGGVQYNFANSGTIVVAAGATLLIDAAAASNSGVLSVGSGGYLRIGDATATGFANTGSLVVAGGILSLDQTLTSAQLPGFGVTNGTLGISGTLTNAGATLTSGGSAGADAQNLLLDGGTIIGGTIVNTGQFTFGVERIAGQPYIGTLSGVTYLGNLALSGASLVVENGFTFASVASAGTPALSLSNGANLAIVGNQTLDNVDILIGGGSGSNSIQAGDYSEASGNILTLGPNAVVTVAGQGGSLEGLYSSDAVINEGTINDTAPGSTLSVGGMQNLGDITLANGAGLVSLSSNAGTIIGGVGSNIIFGPYTIGLSPPFVNTGLITDTQAGSTLSLTGGMTNTGLVSVVGAALALDGKNLTNDGTISVTKGVLAASNMAVSQLDTVKLVNSTVTVTGSLSIDTAAPLRVGTGTSLPTISLSASVSGGTIIEAGYGLRFYGASTFDNITLQGTLNLDRPLTTLTIEDAFAVTNTAGNGPGLINLTSAGSALVWNSAQTFDNALVSIGNATRSYAGHAIAAPALLSASGSLGAHIVIQQSGIYADIGGSPLSTYLNSASGGIDPTQGTITSAATIRANIAHGQLSLEGASFTTTGVIAVSNMDTITEGVAAFTNAGAITIGAASTFAIDTYNYYASGTFADTAFINTGSIALAGGTLTELTGGGSFPAVPILNTGTIRGAGLLDSHVDNAGAIIATGGTLMVDQAISGTGSLVVGTGATLDLTSIVGAGQRVTFGGASGVLGLAPAAFHAKLARFVAGDAIDLAKTAATAAAFSGNAIIVTLSGGGTISLGTTSALSGSLATTSDGHGGTLVEFADSHVVLAPSQNPVLAAPAADPAWAHTHLPDGVQPCWSGPGHVHIQQA